MEMGVEAEAASEAASSAGSAAAAPRASTVPTGEATTVPPTSRAPLSGIISSSDVTYLLGYYLASHIFICGAFTSFYGRNATLDVPISPFSFFDLLILGGRRSGILF